MIVDREKGLGRAPDAGARARSYIQCDHPLDAHPFDVKHRRVVLGNPGAKEPMVVGVPDTVFDELLTRGQPVTSGTQGKVG